MNMRELRVNTYKEFEKLNIKKASVILNEK